MSSQQNGDVLLFIPAFVDTSGPDALQFTVELINGVISMTPAFETAAALSHFGGNAKDDGVPGNPNTYWGNHLETDPAFQYVSRLQFALTALPVTTANLRLLEEAAALDLEWFLTSGIADTVEVEASIPGLNRVDISETITAQGVETQFTFTENWKASI
ncbi:MAG: hypothetical protein V3W41_14495 [Planctomycetota bacterium]